MKHHLLLNTSKGRRRVRRGHTLIEALFASFITLTSAFVFAATVPVANQSRKKAETLTIATSLAQKQIERIRASGYAMLDGQSLKNAGLVDSPTLVNLQSAGLSSTAESGYENTNNDSGETDTPATLLPSGRSFVELGQVDSNTRSLVVVVFWLDKSTWRSVRLGTLVANM